MRKLIIKLSFFLGMALAVNAHAAGFGTNSYTKSTGYGTTSYSKSIPSHTGSVEKNINKKAQKPLSGEFGLNILAGTGMGGGFFGAFDNLDANNLGYRFEFAGYGASKEKCDYYERFIDGDYKNEKLCRASTELTFLVDNIVYWTLVEKDFVKFDLGLNTRLGTVLFYLNLLPYMDLDFTIPKTGVHFNLVANLGLIDFMNHDLKFSVAYELELKALKNFKPGIEVGFQLKTNMFETMTTINEFYGAYIGLYSKF